MSTVWEDREAAAAAQVPSYHQAACRSNTPLFVEARINTLPQQPGLFMYRRRCNRHFLSWQIRSLKLTFAQQFSLVKLGPQRGKARKGGLQYRRQMQIGLLELGMCPKPDVNILPGIYCKHDTAWCHLYCRRTGIRPHLQCTAFQVCLAVCSRHILQ